MHDTTIWYFPLWLVLGWGKVLHLIDVRIQYLSRGPHSRQDMINSWGRQSHIESALHEPVWNFHAICPVPPLTCQCRHLKSHQQITQPTTYQVSSTVGCLPPHADNSVGVMPFRGRPVHLPDWYLCNLHNHLYQEYLWNCGTIFSSIFHNSTM
jgi:hypothetical protein